MRSLFVACIACLIAVALQTPARADDLQDQLHQYFQGIDRLKEEFDDFLRSIPRFETPTIDENGDIIIRRKPPLPPGADPWTGELPQDPEFANI